MVEEVLFCLDLHLCCSAAHCSSVYLQYYSSQKSPVSRIVSEGALMFLSMDFAVRPPGQYQQYEVWSPKGRVRNTVQSVVEVYISNEQQDI